jgi:hypothetical protein
VDVLASKPERNEILLEPFSTINWWPSGKAHTKLLLLPTGLLALLWYSLRVPRRRRVPLCRQVRRRPLNLRLLHARQFLVALFAAASTLKWRMF